MATEGSVAGRELFDDLHIDYEKAYQNNPYKKACVQKVVSLLQRGSRVLDVGCGTGIPVSQILSDAGMDVVGIDIAPKMVELAASRVKGTFEVGDIVDYEPKGRFDAILIIYSQHQLNYTSFHTGVWRLAQALQSDGIIAIGQSPTDERITDDSYYDETKTYVEDYPLNFWGEDIPHFMFSRNGQLDFLRSMGMEIVSETLDWFKPDHPKCKPEHQQYVVARRVKDTPLSEPKPLPKGRSS